MNKNEVIDFLQTCSTPLHFISYAKQLLTSLGFKELHEEDEWSELPINGFVIRQTGAMIAYKYDSLESLFVTTTRCDLLTTYLSKSDTNKEMRHGHKRDFTMYQRPLKCVGYVIVRKNNNADTILFDSGDDALSFFPIPPGSDSDSNTISYNFTLYLKETDEADEDDETNSSVIIRYISKKLGINEDDILDYHLDLINQQRPSIFSDGTLACQNLSFLAPTFSSLQAFLHSEPINRMNVFCAFYDGNEMVSSLSPSIFDNFLSSFVERVFCLDFEKKYLEKSLCLCLEKVDFDPLNSQSKDYNIFYLYSQTQNENDSFNSIKTSLNNSIDFNKLSTKKLDFLASEVAIKRNISIPSISLGFPILSQNSIREYCSLKLICQLLEILTSFFSHNQ